MRVIVVPTKKKTFSLSMRRDFLGTDMSNSCPSVSISMIDVSGFRISNVAAFEEEEGLV